MPIGGASGVLGGRALCTMATAFRNTSGRMTALPTFTYTPPSSPSTRPASRRKSRVRGRAEGGAVARRMHVHRVGADGHVHRDGDVRRAQAAQSTERSALRRVALEQRAAERGPEPDPLGRGARALASAKRRPVSSAAAVGAVEQPAAHVLGGAALRGPPPRRGWRPRRSARSPGRSRARARSISSGPEPDLDHVAAEPPEDGPPRPAGLGDGVGEAPQGADAEEVRQRVEERGHGVRGLRGPGEALRLRRGGPGPAAARVEPGGVEGRLGLGGRRDHDAGMVRPRRPQVARRTPGGTSRDQRPPPTAPSSDWPMG